MNEGNNPYPRFIIDDISGIEMPDGRYQVWAEGYKAGRDEGRMINIVIKARSDMVLVFDAEGEQVPEYQGHYNDVRAPILRDAPPGAVFTCWIGLDDEPTAVPRGDW